MSRVCKCLRTLQLNIPFFIVIIRAKASLNLENQIKKVDGLVSGFEEDLSRDGPIPDTPKALQTQAERIHVSRNYHP